jgi:hypothetical protein
MRVRANQRAFPDERRAFDMARELVEICRLEQGLPALSVIGDFVLPPLDGGETRDFQTSDSSAEPAAITQIGGPGA